MMKFSVRDAIATRATETGDTARLHRTLSRRIYVGLAVCALFAFAIAATVSIYTAKLTYEAQRSDLLTRASDLAQMLDRQVETSRALLQGLSGSPYLKTGDLENFYKQMLETQRPNGNDLVLSDTEMQLLNSRLPYGSPLPRLDVYKPQPGFFEKLSTDGYYVSGAIYGPVLKITATTVTIAIPGDSGRLRYILTSVLTSERLQSALSRLHLPEQMRMFVLDYDNVFLTGDKALYDTLSPLDFDAIRGAGPGGFADPVLHLRDSAGAGYFVTRAKTSQADWTTYVAMQDNAFNQAWRRTWLLLMVGGAIMGIIGVLLYRALRHGLDAPIETMEMMVSDAKDQIALLRQDLLAIRKIEHQRIAQELHDTTAQHLVAADLYLDAMKRSGRAPPPRLIGELDGLIKQALRELRSFSFLLRPPPDSDGALTENLTALYEGYCRRAELTCHIEIDPTVETLSASRRDALFKIAREALTNVHRHAQASTVWLRIAIGASDCVMRIRDDGVGGACPPGPDLPARGLGVQGMQDRALRFGGSVTLSSTGSGTTLELRLPNVSEPAQEIGLQPS